MKIFRLLLFISLLSCAGCATSHRSTSSTHSGTLEERYAQLLRVDREAIANKKLYSFIDEWYGVPYQYAGKTKKGVDCSGLTSILLKEVYIKNISGSSESIYDQCEHITKGELKEGDLVFFKINTKDVSHIGVYLQNNKFVHATTKAGVMIDDLDEDYYKKYFEGAGRVK